MISKILSEGDKVDIIRGQKKESYKSKLLDIADEETLKLSLPTEGSTVIPLEKGARLSLTFFTRKGVYTCRGEIADRYKEGTLYLMVVRLTSELEKIQRRQFYRLPYSMEIEFRKWEEQENTALQSLEEEEVWNQGVTLDLSGGGLRFNSKVFCEPETVLKLRFYIKMKSGIFEQLWDGKVTASYGLPNRPDVFETRIEFLDSDRQKREQLVKFIFEEERKLRQKERGLDH